MRRRDFIALIGSTTAAWPLASRAQQRAIPVIGFLRSTSRDDSGRLVVAFQQGLKLVGYVEGQNVAIEYRWGDNQADRLPALAADLAERKVDVIIANQASAAAVIAATKTIPFVFVIGGDPIKLGLVSSMSRPGGNVTGLTFLQESVGAKQLEIVRELVPQTTAIGMLVHPASTGTEIVLKDLQNAAGIMGLELSSASVNSEGDFEAAFASLAQRKVGALVVPGGAFLLSQRSRIVTLAARHAIPAIYPDREFVVAGGLLSYGFSQTEAYRGAGIYVSKILKGAKPAELPVDESTKPEVLVNLRAAKALGIEMPLSLLMRVSEAIE